MNRREFLKGVTLGAAAVAAGHPLGLMAAESGTKPEASGLNKMSSYKYRIAFGAWINDMRLTPLPLEDWPAPQFDDVAAESIIRAMDVQHDAGYNMLDVWGLFATYGWPVDIVSAVDKDRRRRINRLIKAGKDRGIGILLGFGNYSWGYDKIMDADPSVRGKNPDGSPHAHAMCGANPSSFEYVKKILNFALNEFDFSGVHLESCDQGCCHCPECVGKDGLVGYNIRINSRTADYVKSKWPDKFVSVIPIGWMDYRGQHFSAEQKTKLIELSKHIDCFMDQGWYGTYIAPSERIEFIKSLHCDYGTSGGLWLYPSVRWDRASYFLPYTKRCGTAIKKQFEDGVRGCMLYQGPMSNAGTEVNVAVAGRILSDTRKSVDDALAEVIEHYYKPKSSSAHKRLVQTFQLGEDAFFGQWDPKVIVPWFRYNPNGPVPPIPDELVFGDTNCPGEFLLDNLFGDSPGPATYLSCPGILSRKGRSEYKKGLIAILRDLPEIEDKFDDRGRIDNIKRSVIVTLTLLNTISSFDPANGS